MANMPTIEVAAPAGDVAQVFRAADQVVTSVVAEGQDRYRLQMTGGAWATVVWEPADDETLVLVNDRADDTAGRTLYDTLAAGSSWRVRLKDADTAEVVAERSAA